MAGNHEDLKPGVVLNDRYVIVKRIGGGGMGHVYQAQDKRLSDRLVAVKEMIQTHTDETQKTKAVDDFLREAQLLASLDHPSIPTIFDYFIENGRYYLVMYCIQGKDLDIVMQQRKGRVDEETVTTWAIQVCDVLDYIHKQEPPIIYRDMKPSNLMLDEKRGKIMLIDFGIARFVAPTVKGVTAIGTMGYAPPELFSGKVESRSDLYSLGATLFHMLTGSDPQDNPLLIFDFNKHPRPRIINPAISREMDDILVRMVAHRPEDRPRSAADLKKELEEHMRRFTVGAPSESFPTGMVPCSACGGAVHPNDAFCAHCGAQSPGKVAGPVRAVKLITMDRGTDPHSFVVDGESNLIGRTDPHAQIFPEIDLTKYDTQTKVSRRHARIFKKGGAFFLEDLQSANGTSVNGGSALLPRQTHQLQTGDIVKLGETSLRVVLEN